MIVKKVVKIRQKAFHLLPYVVVFFATLSVAAFRFFRSICMRFFYSEERYLCIRQYIFTLLAKIFFRIFLTYFLYVNVKLYRITPARNKYLTTDECMLPIVGKKSSSSWEVTYE